MVRLADYGLTPETLPEAVADAQRRDVSAAARTLGTTDPAELSAAVDLPVWSVRRRLAELGLGPEVVARTPAVSAARAGRNSGLLAGVVARPNDPSAAAVALVRRYVARSGPATLRQIAAGVRRSYDVVRRVVSEANGFAPAGVRRTAKRPAQMWAVAGT